jgi:Ca2+/Na+ antiporter
MPSVNSFDDLHSKVKKLFNNPNINFFIIMCLILLISCYTFINTPLKFAISSFISNPVIILGGLIIVILMGFYNINIAILILLLLFIILFSTRIFNSKSRNNKKKTHNNSIENFTDETNENNDDNDSDSNSDIDSDDNDNGNSNDNIDVKKNISTRALPTLNKGKSNKELEEEEETNTTDKISSIKNVILGTLNNYKTNSDNEYQKGLLENKQIILNNEQKLNKNNNKSNNNNNKSRLKSNKNSKENFKTVDIRTFDPSKEEDTNLLITKEILTDMINRIEFNFESNKYLKKYLKHRIEEIVEMNKLLEDED